MITPERLQRSIDGYSIGYEDQIVWAPYVMNGIACKPYGDTLSMPGGGKASPEQFRQAAMFARDHLIRQDVEPTPAAIRLALIDGSLPREDSADYNYKGGVDCSGFAYFALKGAGIAIDKAILVPSSAVRHAAVHANWEPGSPELHKLAARADDRALSLEEFVDTFYETPEPQKKVNTTRFDDSSTEIPLNDALPGDLALYTRRGDTNPNHIAVVKDISPQGDIQLVHSGRISWDDEPGGVEEFTIRHKDFSDYADRFRGRIALKRLTAYL